MKPSRTSRAGLLALALMACLRATTFAGPDPLLGQVQIFSGAFVPAGWLACDGQLVPISQYTALFSILGTTYGGDGQTTFALPDLRGRLAAHEGQGPGLTPLPLGAKFGLEEVTLTHAEMPPHSHTLYGSSTTTTAESPTNHYLGVLPVPGYKAYPLSNSYSMHTAMLGNTGGGQATEIVQPFKALHYIIATVGTYPSRP